MTPCELVVESLALDTPRDAALDAHIATCPACARLMQVPGLVASTARATEPAPGFSARITVGARARFAARRRNRAMVLAAAAACVLMAGGVAATRQPPQQLQAAFSPLRELAPLDNAPSERDERDDAPTEPTRDDDSLATELTRLANLDDSLAPSADWRRIEEPLSPYRALLISYQGARP